MSESQDLRRQIMGHLQSLHAAGVEWLPIGPPIELGQVSGVRNQESGGSKQEAGGRQQPPVNPPSRAHLVTLSPGHVVTPPPGQPLTSTPAQPVSPSTVVALQVLADEVKGCTRCPELASTRTQTVFGDGRAGVDLCFIGEAPGADEDAQGLPFVGAAGQLLNKIITACGFKRDEVYICNILKCRPPGNRTPLPNEAANCRGFLERQLDLVQPKYICVLGSCAATNLLETTLSIGKLRGRFHDWRGIPVIATYHPAYLLPHRAPEKKKEVWDDMKMLLDKMGRPIPQRT